MKTWKKCLWMLVLSTLLLSVSVLGAFAAEIRQDGLVVVLETDDDAYAWDDYVTVTLTVTNTNQKDAFDLSLTHLIPDGYCLADDHSDNKDIDVLGAGESVSFTVELVTEDEEETEKGKASGMDLLQIIQIATIVIVVLIVLILVIVIVKKVRSNMVAFFLGMVLLGGSVSGMLVEVKALEPVTDKIRISTEFEMEDDTYTTEAVVKYTVQPNDPFEQICTVTFDTLGIGAVDSQQVENGSLAVRPDPPASEGYVFVNWYADKDYQVEFDFSQPVTKSCTVYARWSTPSMTRAEWIHHLVEALQITTDIQVEEPSFSDIAGNVYEKDIEQAVYQGIITADTGIFAPTEGLTREFAVITAIRGLKFRVGEETIQCKDAQDIENPQYVNFAIKLNMLALENECFYPKMYADTEDIDSVLAVVKEIENSTVADKDQVYEGIDYRDEVIVLPDYYGNTETPSSVQEQFEHTEDGRIILPVTDAVNQLNEGDIVRAENSIHAFKVVATETVGNNVLVEYVEPELEEVVESIDVGGEGIIDIENFIAAEGVEIVAIGTYEEVMQDEYEPVEAYTNSMVYNNRRSATIAPCGWMDTWFDVHNSMVDLYKYIHFKLNPQLPGNVEMEIDVYMQLCSVEYGADIDFKGLKPNVKNAYALLKSKEEITVKVSTKHDLLYPSPAERAENKLTLGSLPIVGTDGIGFLVELEFVYELEGAFELGIQTDLVCGAQVINNELRNLTDADIEVSFGGSAVLKAGLDIGLSAEILNEDVLRAGAQIGYAVEGSIKYRFGGLLCADLTGYVYLEANLMKDTIINKWLKCGISIPIWDKGSSPLKQGPLHWENFTAVPECTYTEGGVLKGKVANASNKSQPIENAEIKIYEVHDEVTLLKTVYTDANGNYQIALPDAVYNIVISADGYIPFDCSQYVAEGQTVYVETFLMVEGSEGDNDTGRISGTITNAVTGYYVPNVELIVRRGWANTYGDEIVATTQTNASGHYDMELPIGNYTILMNKDKYTANYMNVAITKNGNMESNGVITPNDESDIPVGDLRVVLTWGEYPSDLDSHMYGPTSDGSGDQFHVYYSDKKYKYNGEIQCFLDVDDTSSYGPETVTVYSMNQSGVYHYYVHDYSNRNWYSSTEMANSEAKVQVYIGQQMIMSFNVPTDQEGIIWHVFDYDSEFGIITPVNTMGSTYDHLN